MNMETVMDAFDYKQTDKLMLGRYKRYEKLEVGDRVKVRYHSLKGEVTCEGSITSKPDCMTDDFEIRFTTKGTTGLIGSGWALFHIDNLIPL
jgi:hypothetical protein